MTVLLPTCSVQRVVDLQGLVPDEHEVAAVARAAEAVPAARVLGPHAGDGEGGGHGGGLHPVPGLLHQHQLPPGDGQLVPGEVPEPGELHPPGEDVHLALQPGQDTALL